MYLSVSDLLSSIISNTVKHEFSSIWNWISCCNDVMNHIHCVIKHDVYPQKFHSCSKNICAELQIYGVPAPLTQDFKKMVPNFSR